MSPAEDSPMKGVSDDDDEEETYVPPAPADMEIVNKSRKERKENEEKLRQMMEMDDEDEEEEIKEIEEPEVVEKEASVEKEVPPTVDGGRRRGRRRVMKKKTVKDEEGYLGKYYVLITCVLLIGCSDEGRTCLGIIFGRRASSNAKAQITCSGSICEGQEGSWKGRAGQYHVFLR